MDIITNNTEVGGINVHEPHLSSSFGYLLDGGASSLNLHFSPRCSNSFPHISLHGGHIIAPL